MADVTGAGDTVIATFAVSLAAGASFARSRAPRESRRRTRRDEARHRDGERGRARGRGDMTSEVIVQPPTRTMPQRSSDDRDRSRTAGARRRRSRGRADHRVRERLFRRPPCRPRPVSRRRRRAKPTGSIVAINDDESVAALKGAGRPLVPADARAEVVAALRGVDYVVVFPDRTVDRLLDLLRARRALQGHRLHRGHGSGAGGRAGVRWTDRHRRRSEGSLDAGSAGPAAHGWRSRCQPGRQGRLM